MLRVPRRQCRQGVCALGKVLGPSSLGQIQFCSVGLCRATGQEGVLQLPRSQDLSQSLHDLKAYSDLRVIGVLEATVRADEQHYSSKSKLRLLRICKVFCLPTVGWQLAAHLLAMEQVKIVLYDILGDRAGHRHPARFEDLLSGPDGKLAQTQVAVEPRACLDLCLCRQPKQTRDQDLCQPAGLASKSCFARTLRQQNEQAAIVVVPAAGHLADM